MLQFEFHVYRADEFGVFLHDLPEVQTRRYAGDSAARAAAGRLAKRHKGPVDLVRAGAADWTDRYLTTASPSEFHTAGYRFERLDS